LFGWIEKGALVSQHLLPEELEAVRRESVRYRDRWVDFADACIVVTSDRHPKLPLVTVDGSDFSVYFRRRPAVVCSSRRDVADGIESARPARPAARRVRHRAAHSPRART
jgi:hypothetical protein